MRSVKYRPILHSGVDGSLDSKHYCTGGGVLRKKEGGKREKEENCSKSTGNHFFYLNDE